MNKFERRDSPEGKAKMLPRLVDQMKEGWTDRGLKRLIVSTGYYQKENGSSGNRVGDFEGS